MAQNYGASERGGGKYRERLPAHTSISRAFVWLMFTGVKPLLSVFNRIMALFWGVIPKNKLSKRTFAPEN